MAILRFEQKIEIGGDDTSTQYRWHAITDVYMTKTQILSSSQVPKKGARLDSTSYYVTNRFAEIDPENKCVWYITLTYSLSQVTTGTGSSNRLLSLSYDSVIYQTALEKAYSETDTDNTDIVDVENSAGDPFDPPIAFEVRNTLIRFSQRESSTFNAVNALKLRNTMNNQAITVCGIDIPAKKGLIRNLQPTLQEDGDWVSGYEIEVEDEKPLLKSVRDQGFRFLGTIEGTSTIALFNIKMSDINTGITPGNKDDKVVSDPVKLIDGAILPHGSPTEYINFRPQKLADWGGALNLVRNIT